MRQVTEVCDFVLQIFEVLNIRWKILVQNVLTGIMANSSSHVFVFNSLALVNAIIFDAQFKVQNQTKRTD